jgi:hypothetical protein
MKSFRTSFFTAYIYLYELIILVYFVCHRIKGDDNALNILSAEGLLFGHAATLWTQPLPYLYHGHLASALVDFDPRRLGSWSEPYLLLDEENRTIPLLTFTGLFSQDTTHRPTGSQVVMIISTVDPFPVPDHTPAELLQCVYDYLVDGGASVRWG